MSSISIRNIVRCGWWLTITAIAIVATAWVVLEHYLNAANALELLGTEQKPLTTDSLLRVFLGAVLPYAALPQAMAMIVVLVEAIAFILIATQCRHMIALIWVWRLRRELDDAMRAKVIRRLLRAGVVLVCVIGVLIGVVRWELALFQSPGLSPIDRLLNLFDDPVSAWVTERVWRSAFLMVVGALWVAFSIDRLGEALACSAQSIARDRG